MSYKIVVTPDAVRNIEQAVEYYKNVASANVARMFADDYKNTVKAIRKTKYFRYFFQDFRAKPMKKFPYIVFYTIDKNLKTIIIKAVFNTHQNPEKYPTK